MKTSAILWLLQGAVLVGLTSLAHARTFKSTSGDTFEGEIRRVSPDGKEVTVERMQDRKQFVVPVERFIQSDQEAIRKWAAQNISYNLTANLTVKTLDKSTRPGNRSTIETKKTAYSVDLSNRSFATLNDLRVDYVLFKESYNGSVSRSKGSHKISAFEHNTSTTFVTESIDLVTEEMDANWRLNGKLELADELAGI